MSKSPAAGYRLATYQTADGPRAGLVVGDKLFDAAKLTGKAAYATVLSILDDWKAAQATLRKAAANAGKRWRTRSSTCERATWSSSSRTTARTPSRSSRSSARVIWDCRRSW